MNDEGTAVEMDLVLTLTLLVLQQSLGFCRTINSTQELKEPDYGALADLLRPILQPKDVKEPITQIKTLQVHPEDKTIDAKSILDIMNLLQKNKDNKSPVAIILATPDVASEFLPKKIKHKPKKGKLSDDITVQGETILVSKEIELEIKEQSVYEDLDEVDVKVDKDLSTEGTNVEEADTEEGIEPSQIEKDLSKSEGSKENSGSVENSEGSKESVDDIGLKESSKGSSFINEYNGTEALSFKKGAVIKLNALTKKGDDNDDKQQTTGISEILNRILLNTKLLKKLNDQYIDSTASDRKEIDTYTEEEVLVTGMGQSDKLEEDGDINEWLNLELISEISGNVLDLNDNESNVDTTEQEATEAEETVLNEIRNINLKPKIIKPILVNAKDKYQGLSDVISFYGKEQKLNAISCETELNRDKERKSPNKNTYNFSFFFNRK